MSPYDVFQLCENCDAPFLMLALYIPKIFEIPFYANDFFRCTNTKNFCDNPAFRKNLKLPRKPKKYFRNTLFHAQKVFVWYTCQKISWYLLYNNQHSEVQVPLFSPFSSPVRVKGSKIPRRKKLALKKSG